VRRLAIGLIRATLLVLVITVAPGLIGAPAGTTGARAASPAPSAGSGDTRSAGEAPGFVGAPVLAIGVVATLGLLAALATVIFVRITGGAGTGVPPDRPATPSD
jgi:hypothetical protein